MQPIPENRTFLAKHDAKSMIGVTKSHVNDSLNAGNYEFQKRTQLTFKNLSLIEVCIITMIFVVVLEQKLSHC